MSDSPKGESRSYVVGLPVLVTVWDDGTVVYDIDTAEAGQAVREDADIDTGTSPEDGLAHLMADAAFIDADHDRRNGH